jgi:hypothetical protein
MVTGAGTSRSSENMSVRCGRRGIGKDGRLMPMLKLIGSGRYRLTMIIISNNSGIIITTEWGVVGVGRNRLRMGGVGSALLLMMFVFVNITGLKLHIFYPPPCSMKSISKHVYLSLLCFKSGEVADESSKYWSP